MTAVPTVERSLHPVRRLTADELGVGVIAAATFHTSNRPDSPQVTDDDPRLLSVQKLLKLYGGVIFTGPPGTSKTFYAAAIALALTEGDETRVRFVQFHPSYQYEDFMQGFIPKQDGTGFTMRDSHFLQMCKAAEDAPGQIHVLVIDELSRADVGRVFGEALTYVEKSKRGLPFRLASGREAAVPPNLVILATMNPLDRGVDEVDAAFERRFAKIPMDPDRRILGDILDSNEVVDPLRKNIMGFFDMINGRARTNPQAAIGHTYFLDVVDEETLRSVWDHQLRFLVEKAFRLDPESREEVEARWSRIVSEPSATKEDMPTESKPPEGAGADPSEHED